MKGKFLILGSNLGNRSLMIQHAIDLIQQRIGNILSESSIYETEPWGYENQPKYLNKVIQINTSFTPLELLKEVNSIEKDLGRIRYEKWHERIVDIDILYFDDVVLNTSVIKLPHPEIPNRRFTLEPMCEIAADEIHPVLGKTQKEMLKMCPDKLEVNKI